MKYLSVAYLLTGLALILLWGWVKKLPRKLWNLVWYWKWTDCRHEKWIPEGYADWECRDCGALK